jgi:hypothetical protein
LNCGCNRDVDILFSWTFEGSSYWFLTCCILDIYVARIHDFNFIMRDRQLERQNDGYLDIGQTHALVVHSMMLRVTALSAPRRVLIIDRATYLLAIPPSNYLFPGESIDGSQVRIHIVVRENDLT